MTALQKLKEDKENAKNKPKVAPKASNKPTKYVMPKFGEEERTKKKSNKINAGGYNIDGGYYDSDESDQDLENTVPDEDGEAEEPNYNLPAYGPDFIENDFDYGYQERNPEKGGSGRAPKSPTKKTSAGSINSSSPVREPRHGHNDTNANGGHSRSSSNLSNTNAKSNNGNNYGHVGSTNTTPTKSPSVSNTRLSNVNTNNANMGYSNYMPAVPVQTTLERSFFPSTPRNNSGGANDFEQRAQAANINDTTNNTINVVHLDSSPLGKNNNNNNQQQQPAPKSPNTGPKIRIKLEITALKNKSLTAFAIEHKNGAPKTVADLKKHIAKKKGIEVTSLKLGEFLLDNDKDAVRDLLKGDEEIVVEIKEIKKELVDVYKEKCQSEGILVNEMLASKLLKPSNLQLNGKGVVRVRDLEVLSKSIDLHVVEHINLSENALGMPYFADLERLLVKQNKCLKSLNLSNCNLTDPTMFQALTSLNSLQELNISGNAISDNGGVQFMAALPNLASLTNLDLSRCNVGPLTMKALEDSRFCDNGIFPQNKGLAVVSASFNKLQSVGVNHLTAALCQRTTTSLLTLKLQQVEISENDQNHCAKSLYKLMVLKTGRLADLDLSANVLTSKLRWIGQGINDSIHLHTIRLKKCGLNSESLTDIVDALQFSQSLTCLELSENILGKAGADLISQVLQKPHKLQQLKLNSCGLTSVGLLQILRSCHGQNLHFNIARLELENNCDVEFSRVKYGDRHLTDAFSKLNAKLTYLELSRNSINDDDVRNALKQSWEDIHGKEQLSITISQVSLRFMKKHKKI